MPAAPPVDVGAAAGPAPPEEEEPPVEVPQRKRRKGKSVVCKPTKRKKTMNNDPPPASELEQHLAGIRALSDQHNAEMQMLKQKLDDERAANRAEVLELLKLRRALQVLMQKKENDLEDTRAQLATEVADKTRAIAELKAALDLVPPPPQVIAICSNCGDGNLRGSVCAAVPPHEICHECLADFALLEGAAMTMFRSAGDVHLPCTVCDDDGRDGFNLTKALFDSIEPHKTTLLLALENFGRVTGRLGIFTEAAQESRTYESPLERVELVIRQILENRVRGCGHRYVDFNGCLMLTCAAPDCRNRFCGYCDEIIARNANGHAHVRACPENANNGSEFMPMQLFMIFKKTQRRQRLEAYLATLDATFVALHAATIAELVDYLIE